MNDIDVTEVQRALRGLAEAGPAPDETAAWEAIAQRIEAEARRTRRTRLIAAGGGALAAGAAVLALVLVGALDRDEAIDVGPAQPGATVTTPSTATGDGGTTESSVGQPVALPAATLVATSADGTQLHVLDGATGQRVSTPVTLESGYIGSAAITRAGIVFFSVADLQGGTEVRRTTWDAAGESTVVDELPAFAESFTLDPTESTLAFGLGSSGGAEDPSRIGFYDLGSGEVRYLDWRDDEDPDRRTGGISGVQLSPDGTELVFSASQDSFDPIESFVLSVDAGSLSDARSLGRQVGSVRWMYDGSLVGVRDLEIGSSGPLTYLEGGPEGGLPAYEGQLDGVPVTGAAGLVIRTIDASGGFHLLRLVAEADQWVALESFADMVIAASR